MCGAGQPKNMVFEASQPASGFTHFFGRVPSQPLAPASGARWLVFAPKAGEICPNTWVGQICFGVLQPTELTEKHEAGFILDPAESWSGQRPCRLSPEKQFRLHPQR